MYRYTSCAFALDDKLGIYCVSIASGISIEDLFGHVSMLLVYSVIYINFWK